MSIDTTKTEKTIASGATGATDWVRVRDKLAIQITGAATGLTVLVERSTRDPASAEGANIAVVETLTGNLVNGLAPVGYDEPGDAWWRARATVVTGGQAVIAVNGVWGG
jgi:hypothetical protein